MYFNNSRHARIVTGSPELRRTRLARFRQSPDLGYHSPPLFFAATRELPMQLLADFLPLLFFFAAYIYDDLYFAVGVLMIAMPIGLVLKTYLTKKLDKIYLGSTIFLLVLGSATLFFRNPLFLYWKPTAFYWVASIVFLASQWIGEKPIVERLFAQAAVLGREQWIKLNLMWVVFFVFAGALNIYVAYTFSEPVWVKFKVFGLLALTLVFVIIQAVWMTTVSSKNESAAEEPKA
jgi:intracellular septation protein